MVPPGKMPPVALGAEILKSKVCLVGDLAVGKTSLIHRYVLNVFDDQYLTTLGTKVTKKVVPLSMPERGVEVRMDMMIWDIMGQHGFQELLKDAYFFGARGILAVADLTRRETLSNLDSWIDCVESVAGEVPILIAVNKADLDSKAAFTRAEIEQTAAAFDSEYLMTSAKTGLNIEEAFHRLARTVAEGQLETGEQSY